MSLTVESKKNDRTLRSHHRSERCSTIFLLDEKQRWGKPKMLEREAWRFINNRRKDDAEYLKSLDSVSNQEERELLWKDYSEKQINGRKNVGGLSIVSVSGYTTKGKIANR